MDKHIYIILDYPFYSLFLLTENIEILKENNNTQRSLNNFKQNSCHKSTQKTNQSNLKSGKHVQSMSLRGMIFVISCFWL